MSSIECEMGLHNYFIDQVALQFQAKYAFGVSVNGFIRFIKEPFLIICTFFVVAWTLN